MPIEADIKKLAKLTGRPSPIRFGHNNVSLLILAKMGNGILLFLK